MPRRSRPKFDKDIELAKLQVKISDAQSFYHSLLSVIYSVMVALALIMWSVPNLPWDKISILFTILILMIGFSISLTLSYVRKKEQFVREFRKIYRNQPIDF